MPLDWSLLWLSLRYAGAATLVSILAALPLGWLLARGPFRGSELLDAAANLPLVLPPAVLVYYLLTALGRWKLEFNWNAAVALSAIYTLPLVLRMTRAGLEAVDHSFENAARALGAGEWRTFRRITLPLAWRALCGAALAGFARALADFGATAIAASSLRGLWLLLPIAAAALAALYVGNRLRRGRVLA
ncbi:MAG TPA: ABC transporter permease subunit [Bryobacteraceae bacterium]|nr:ABC transporter permease subunit [Bryobacteraceae bacterium]